ncbi:MAG TPA: M1 family metallopeptidase, partial [Polyangiales bacterium]|nr:M1 family metallopeptidase [Polyangiales bacterium]
MSRTSVLTGLIACSVLLPSATVQADSPERPSYALHARLDPDAGVLHGRAQIRWPNRSRAPVRELYFHLYANAFEHDQTLFMREGGRRLRGGRLARRGGIELRTLQLLRAGKPIDLLAHAERELWPGDRTQLRVALPAPLPPGEALELAIEFELRLPSLVARMGRAGDFFMLGQWYPKLAKHEPDGRWVSFPYHGMGEFYADFADHTLELVVPRQYVIAAPGSLQSAQERSDGTRVERYALDGALDVAWAAYPAFRRERTRAGSVELEAFAPPGNTRLARAQLALIREGLARLGQRLGPYPHERFVLVLPPESANGASGMEYPGLIVGATASWHSELSERALALHELTTTHELAHQWFPLLIASNEVATPMLDEGLSQWLGLDLLRARHGRASALARLAGLPFDAFELMRAGFATARNVPSSLLPAWRYRASELGPAVYARPALVLETLRRSHGEA